MPWPSQAEHNQDDADDREDEPDGKPHPVARHETSRDQIQALPTPDSTEDKSDHADGDQGDASATATHVYQRTLTDSPVARPPFPMRAVVQSTRPSCRDTRSALIRHRHGLVNSPIDCASFPLARHFCGHG